MASDAAYEDGRGSAGLLVVLNPGQPTEARLGKVIEIPQVVYSLWGARKTYIAQLELLAVFVAMVEIAALVRHTHGLWFIDNIAALMALVKGTSGVPSLDAMAKAVEFLRYRRRPTTSTSSQTNWSDEISRLGVGGSWAVQNGFEVERCGVAVLLLQLPCIAIASVFAFL